MKSFMKLSSAVAMVVMISGTALAADISLDNAWSRATLKGAKVGAGYVTIKNSGATADKLVSATADVAGKVEIHEMKMVGGVMKMRPIKGLDIPAGKSVELKPGGFHIMFEQLKQPLLVGDTVTGTLTFEKSGSVPVQYKVEAMGGMKGMQH